MHHPDRVGVDRFDDPFAVVERNRCSAAVGRGFVESLRIDEAHHFFGIRLNVFTAIVVALGALIYLVVSARLRPGRETPDELQPLSSRALVMGDATRGTIRVLH